MHCSSGGATASASASALTVVMQLKNVLKIYSAVVYSQPSVAWLLALVRRLLIDMDQVAAEVAY